MAGTHTMKRKHSVILASCLAALLLASALLWMASGLTGRVVSETGTKPQLPDTLRVGVLNSPSTYFNYRGDTLGYDYEMVKKFASDHHMALLLKVAYNFQDLMDLLEKRDIDLAASPVPVTAEFRSRAIPCGPKSVSCQVLVQRDGENRATDVTQLIGRRVSVEKDSKYEYRLRNLNDEIGGGIVVETIEKDTLLSEDIMKMVADRKLDSAVVDSDIARLNIRDFPGLDASLHVSLDQESRWAVGKGENHLGRLLNVWTGRNKDFEKKLRDKYYGTSKLPAGLGRKPEAGLPDINLEGDCISPFDPIFRAAASETGFDWRLIAAVAYVESRFKPELVSWAGAMGVMQVMPATARQLGFDPGNLRNPETSIRAGVKLLGKLDKLLAPKVPDAAKRVDFMLAAYNAGLGHIYDSMALAGKYGLNRNVWCGGVERAALMKSKPEYYRDPVVKNGYFRGRETVDFVNRVREAYEIFKKKSESSAT